MVCKTYRGDLQAFKRMLTSFILYNKDNIELFVSVPEKDKDLFKSIVGNKATIITDESYCENYYSDERYWGLELGNKILLIIIYS
jgi:hypothetical protein